MGLFDIFKKKTLDSRIIVKARNEVEITEFSKKRDLIFNELREKTAVQSLRLTANRSAVSLTGSKFGGTPYFPKRFKYPCNFRGEPLRLLAQLNFDELPELDGFPQKGILQFFVNEGELWGLDFDNPPEIQNNYRVIYHETILDGDEVAHDLPQFSKKRGSLPFVGEFSIHAEYEYCPMTITDFRFNKTFMEIYKKHINTNENMFIDLDVEIQDDIWDYLFDGRQDVFPQKGHRICGYPYFCQEDSRGFGSDYEAHTILLFQMDSDGDVEKTESGEWEKIAWGDGGVANFLITSDALKRLDFSDVLYNWDCY